MNKKVMLSIGRKELKNLNVDKNGFVLLKIKELPMILGGSMLNIEMPFSDWQILKAWVDSHYDRLLFFEQFPNEKEYHPLLAKLARQEKENKGECYNLKTKEWESKKVMSSLVKIKWWKKWLK